MTISAVLTRPTVLNHHQARGLAWVEVVARQGRDSEVALGDEDRGLGSALDDLVTALMWASWRAVRPAPTTAPMAIQGREGSCRC